MPFYKKCLLLNKLVADDDVYQYDILEEFTGKDRDAKTNKEKQQNMSV